MRHNVAGRKLGRTTAHRRAMFRNQLASLVASGRIRTTLAKAKELRPLAEKMVTRGRTDTVHSRRMVRRWLQNRTLIKKLFEEISPRFLDRPGGYLRIVKLGPRRGDAAEMAILEFVDHGGAAEKAETPKAKKAKPKGKAKAKKPTKKAAKKAAKKTAAKTPAKKAAKKPAKKSGEKAAKTAE